MSKRRLEENEWRRITRIEDIVKRAETSSMEDPVKLVTNSSLRRLLGLKGLGSESIDSVSTKAERIEGVSVSVREVLHYKFPKRVSEREGERGNHSASSPITLHTPSSSSFSQPMWVKTTSFVAGG